MHFGEESDEFNNMEDKRIHFQKYATTAKDEEILLDFYESNPFHLCVLELIHCLVSAETDEFDDTINELHETAIKGADGAILMFDVTNRPTLDGVRAYYEKLIKIKETDEIPMVILGTKTDVEGTGTVSLMEGDEFAEEFQSTYFEVSAKFRNIINQTIFLFK
jgi:hypothetical protein